MYIHNFHSTINFISTDSWVQTYVTWQLYPKCHSRSNPSYFQFQVRFISRTYPWFFSLVSFNAIILYPMFMYQPQLPGHKIHNWNLIWNGVPKTMIQSQLNLLSITVLHQVSSGTFMGLFLEVLIYSFESQTRSDSELFLIPILIPAHIQIFILNFQFISFIILPLICL